MTRRTILMLALATALGAFIARAQHAVNAADSIGRVPALEQFHEVIFPLWHEAWPAKNIGMLKELLPRVNAGIDAIAGAALPGILREKKDAWVRGVESLRSAGRAYASAAAKGDSLALLDAAENLHARYEALLRVLRPALREMEEFHAGLYGLYHRHLPAGDIPAIRASVAALRPRLDALNAARLPARWQGKAEAFAAARRDLSASFAALEGTLASGDSASVVQAVEAMHGRYMELSAVLE